MLVALHVPSVGCLFKKSVMLRSLFAPLHRRLVLFVASTTLVGICVVVFISATTITLSKTSRLEQLLKEATSTIVIAMQEPFSLQDAKNIMDKISANKPWPFVEFLALYDSTLTPIASIGNVPLLPFAPGLKQQTLRNRQFATVFTPILSNGKPVAYLFIGNHEKVFDHGLKKYLLLSLGAASISICICILIASRFYKRAMSPLFTLSKATAEITASQDYTLRVPKTSDDEIGKLITQFNAMLEQIETRDKLLMDHQRELEHTVLTRTVELARNNVQLKEEVAERKKAEMIRSEVERINQHDLKSLLNLVIGYPELLLGTHSLDEQQIDYIKKIEQAGYSMLDMINNNLDIFKMEQGIYKLCPSNVDIVQLLYQIQDETISLLNRTEVALTITCNSKPIEENIILQTTGEYRLLRNLFFNLITNAIEASDTGDIVTINIEPEKHKVSVHNKTVVPAPVRSRFFEKYATYGKEDGTGLGTYSAKLIASAHKARISMASTEPIGTLVSVKFAGTTCQISE